MEEEVQVVSVAVVSEVMAAGGGADEDGDSTEIGPTRKNQPEATKKVDGSGGGSWADSVDYPDPCANPPAASSCSNRKEEEKDGEDEAVGSDDRKSRVQQEGEAAQRELEELLREGGIATPILRRPTEAKTGAIPRDLSGLRVRFEGIPEESSEEPPASQQ